jgi:transcriptional regulator with XRE-family HTH domain
MGGLGSGRQRDPAREAAMAELRRQGLTLAEIGRRFGVSKQAVKATLDRPPAPPRPPKRPKPPPAACRECGTLIRPTRQGRLRIATLCLACLAERPDATRAERLRAHRMAAGLSREQLAARVGVVGSAITHYETGRRRLSPKMLARLAEVLGEGLVGEARRAKRERG